MTIGLSADTNGWDPTESQWAGQAYQVGRAVFDPLVAVAGDGTLVPYLAEELTTNDEFTAWTIRVRPDVRFHDGSALDAAAVKKNFDASRASILIGQTLTPIADVVEVDPLTVRVDMKEPWSTFPGYLAAQMGYMAAPAMIDDPDGAERPVGTGPFVFEEWNSGSNFVANRNPDYWREGFPLLDEVEFRFLPDGQARSNAFNSRDVDVVELVTADSLRPYETSARAGENQFLVDDRFETGEITVALNTATPPFDDVRARRAVAAAVDTNLMADSLFDGVYPPADGPFVDGSRSYVDSNYPDYDVEEAKRLAAEYEAERGQPIEFELLIPPDPVLASLAQVLEQSMREAGMVLRINQVQQPALLSSVFVGGDYQAAGWIAFSTETLESENVFLSGSNAKPLGQISVNFTRIDDPAINEAMKVFRSTSDPAVVDEQNRIVQERLGELVPYVFLVHTKSALAVDNRVHGIGRSTLPDGSTAGLDGVTMWLHDVWVEQP